MDLGAFERKLENYTIDEVLRRVDVNDLPEECGNMFMGVWRHAQMVMDMLDDELANLLRD